MASRTYPNDYFAWFNDDQRLAILCLDTTSTTSGERTTEKYDTFQDDGNLSGTITNMLTDGSTVTVTCSAVHSLAANDRVTISGTSLYDENYTVAAIPTTSKFTFSSSAVAASADTISDLDVASGTATVTTSANHGYSVGDVVYIDASNNTYDEQVTIVTTNGTNQFTYTTSNGDTTNLTGTVGDTGTFASLFVNDGLRITYKAKYTAVTAVTNNLDTDIGLDTSLHSQLVCYVKSRLYEDQGNAEQANYFRQMYESQMMKQRSRKSGVRSLSVPNM